MNGNYIKNKLLLGLGIFTILFGISNLAAFAQQKYPSAAAIEAARTKFKNVLRSLQNNHYHNQMSSYIRDHLSPEEKQAQNNFVNAWKQVNPAIAPFLGSWIGNEEQAWGIHPSNKTGSVCLIKIQVEGLSLEIGTVANNSIYTNKGKVFIKEGNYLGFETIKNNQLDSTSIGGILHNSFTKLQNPYSFKNIDGQPPSTALLRTYTDAGCTAALPQNNTNNAAAKTPIQNLPDGNYTYGEVAEPGIIRNNYLAFRKSGDMVTGISYYPHSGGFPCFQGTARGNNIINATVITPVMGEPGKDDSIDRNQSFDLNNYYRIDSQAQKDFGSINHCIRTIISDVPQKQLSLVSSRYKQPSPNVEIPDIVKLKTMAFVKGEKGFYALKHTDNSGKCVGINRQINKLVSMHCSYANFFMWNLIPIKFSDSDKLGYIINLRGTHNCLSIEDSITSCNNLGKLVANSLRIQ